MDNLDRSELYKLWMEPHLTSEPSDEEIKEMAKKLDVPPELPPTSAVIAIEIMDDRQPPKLIDLLRAVKEAYAHWALYRANQNKAAGAELIGTSRSEMYRMLRRVEASVQRWFTNKIWDPHRSIRVMVKDRRGTILS